MKLSRWSAVVLLCLSMFLGVRAVSSEELQPLEPLEPAWLTEMIADGWQKVEEGVLQRELSGGNRETFAYGTEGLEWIAQGYEQRIQRLEDRYSASPSEELAELIDQLKSRLGSLYQQALAAPAAESFGGEERTDCTRTVDGDPQAFATESPRGVSARASVAYDGCGEVADVFMFAYADATYGDLRDESRKTLSKKTSLITTTLSASAIGDSGCFSEAVVDVSLNGTSLRQKSDLQYGCPPSPTVSITGPSQITTDHYNASYASCKVETWTASASGGTTPYSYHWYIDGIDFQDTGPSLTMGYCGVDTTVTIKVVAKDDNGWTAEATTTIQIRHIGPVIASVSGPSTVVHNTSACVNVTWTGSATGGHPGYTYSWYVGTGPTVQGTSSTFTKNFCASQTVTVKLIARDSDGHTDEEPFTTQIQITPPFEATITGPPTITTDHYDPDCQTVTWTANATAGHPGYTYSWYFGTSTAVQGTGSTFMKDYCTGDPKPLDVKVTARDSDGHTDDATFTTNVQELGIIQVQIQGPTSVTTSTANPCVNVTWSAAPASVGHSGFTYQWYIGSTLQGTGSWLTKQYCNISTTVNVTVFVRASDRHGATTGHMTTVTHQP